MALTVPFTALAATGKAAMKARPIGGILERTISKRREKKKRQPEKRHRNTSKVRGGMCLDIKGHIVYRTSSWS